MKITHIAVRNLIGITECSLPITKPVNLFLAENGAGKTSLASVLEYIASGTTRGLNLKKDRHRLIHRGSGKAEAAIILENGVTLKRSTTPTTDNFRATINGQEKSDWPFNFNLVSLNPLLYFDLSEEKRKALLYRLVGSESSAEIVKAKLIERGVSETAAAAVAEQVAENGFTAMQNATIEGRRALKRERDELQGLREPVTKIAIEDADYQLPDYTVAQLNTAIAALDEERSAKLVEKGRVGSAVAKADVQARLDAVIEELTQAEVLRDELRDPAALKDKIKERSGEIEKLNSEINAARATRQLMDENLNLKVPALDFEKCPVMEGVRCPVPEKDRKKVRSVFEDRRSRAKQVADEAEKTIAELQQQLKDKSDEKQAWQDDLDDLEQKIKDGREVIGGLRNRKAELEKALATAVDTVADTGKLDEEIRELTFRAEVGRKLIRAVEGYLKQKDAFEHAGAKITALDSEIRLHDVLDKALSPNGIPAELTMDALGSFKARLAETGKVFAAELDVNQDDYLPLWNGQHYNLLSESEQWRCRALFQEAIAFLSKTPWLILDSADILDFRNRGNLFDLILDLLSGYAFVGVFATQNQERIPVIEHDLIDFWHIDNGRVALMKPVAAEAA